MRAAHASRATIFARCNAAKRLDDLSFSAKKERCYRKVTPLFFS